MQISDLHAIFAFFFARRTRPRSCCAHEVHEPPETHRGAGEHVESGIASVDPRHWELCANCVRPPLEGWSLCYLIHLSATLKLTLTPRLKLSIFPRRSRRLSTKNLGRTPAARIEQAQCRGKLRHRNLQALAPTRKFRFERCSPPVVAKARAFHHERCVFPASDSTPCGPRKLETRWIFRDVLTCTVHCARQESHQTSNDT